MKDIRLYVNNIFWIIALETKQKKAKICCLDLDKDCLNLLNERFDVYDGSLGKPIDVSGKNYRGLNLLLNYELPLNVHEYDIFIEDWLEIFSYLCQKNNAD